MNDSDTELEGNTSSRYQGSVIISKVETLPLWVTMAVCTIVMVSNFLVLVILLCKSELRKNSKIEFILWLCLSDIIVGISGWLFLCNYFIKDLRTNVTYCRLMYHFIAAGVGQSLSHTLLICIDRYMAVITSNLYRQFNKKHRYSLIVGTWLAIHIFVGILVTSFLRAEKIAYCSLKSFPQSNFFLGGVSILYLPLLILIPSLYAVVIAKFRNQTRKIHNITVLNVAPFSNSARLNVNLAPSISGTNGQTTTQSVSAAVVPSTSTTGTSLTGKRFSKGNLPTSITKVPMSCQQETTDNQQTSSSNPETTHHQQTTDNLHVYSHGSRRRKYEKNIIVTIGIIVLTLMILTGPFALVLFLEGFGMITVNRTTRILISLMSYLNSAVNPVLYIWRISKFREQFMKSLCRC